MKKISLEVYEFALDKEREEFFHWMGNCHEVIEIAAIAHGIPLEIFDKEWDKFISKLDDSLIENFSLDRDSEDE